MQLDNLKIRWNQIKSITSNQTTVHKTIYWNPNQSSVIWIILLDFHFSLPAHSSNFDIFSSQYLFILISVVQMTVLTDSTQPGHPSVRRHNEPSESWGVNRHVTRCTKFYYTWFFFYICLVSINVWSIKISTCPVYSWSCNIARELKKRRSAPPHEFHVQKDLALFLFPYLIQDIFEEGYSPPPKLEGNGSATSIYRCYRIR